LDRRDRHRCVGVDHRGGRRERDRIRRGKFVSGDVGDIESTTRYVVVYARFAVADDHRSAVALITLGTTVPAFVSSECRRRGHARDRSLVEITSTALVDRLCVVAELRHRRDDRGGSTSVSGCAAGSVISSSTRLLAPKSREESELHRRHRLDREHAVAADRRCWAERRAPSGSGPALPFAILRVDRDVHAEVDVERRALVLRALCPCLMRVAIDPPTAIGEQSISMSPVCSPTGISPSSLTSSPVALIR